MLTHDLHTWSISLDSADECWLKLRPALFPVLRESLLSWQIGKKVGIKQFEINSGTIMKVLQRVRFVNLTTIKPYNRCILLGMGPCPRTQPNHFILAGGKSLIHIRFLSHLLILCPIVMSTRPMLGKIYYWFYIAHRKSFFVSLVNHLSRRKMYL